MASTAPPLSSSEVRRGTTGRSGSGNHSAILPACSRAFALSVMPENRRRSSVAADSSPSCS